MNEAETKNIQAIGSAILQIRSEALDLMGVLRDAGMDSSVAMRSAKKIQDLADRIHNVPTMLELGTACDAWRLLSHGVDTNWPTGIPGDHNVKYGMKPAPKDEQLTQIGVPA